MTLIANNFNHELFSELINLGADLRDKEFTNCQFRRCDFSGNDWSGAVIIDCNFVECNLSNIKVIDSSWQGVCFENCKILGVDWSTINTLLINWQFRKCKISLCDFSGLVIKLTNFGESWITDTDFSRADLSGANLADCDLTSSKFYNSILEKADLRGAKNYYIDPINNKLKKAKFSYPEVLSLLAGFGIEIV